MTRTHPRRRLRASIRRALATTTIGIVLVSLGVLAGSGPAIGDQSIATSLGYTCEFPSGTQQIQAQVKATFPETAAVNAPIEPTDFSARLDIPQVALGDLTSMGAASMSTKADFAVVAKHNGDDQTSTWPDLTAPSSPLPSTGDLSVTVSGMAVPVKESDPGDVVFTADAFGLLFAPLTSTGDATTPATVAVACTVNPNQAATLATVAIPVAPPTSASAGGSAKPGTTHKNTVKPHDDGTPPADPVCNKPNGTEEPVTGADPLSAVLLTRTNLNKLGESTAVSGIIYLTNTEFWISDDFLDYASCYTAQLAMDPSTTTVLGFGFVPITTTLKYVQANTPDNPMVVDVTSTIDTSVYPDGHPTGHSSGLVDIYVVSASINGTPLNVGPNCRTRTPVSLTVDNLPELNPDNSETYQYAAAGGGYMQGTVDIPPFTDCGVGDNLDTLLSAPVAGPNNLTRVCQGIADDVADGPPVPPSQDSSHCVAPR
jgi:hypothetical protein